MIKLRAIVIMLLFSVSAFGSIVQDTNNVSRDKNSFNIFNPIPINLMRKMSADRPDKTDCPFTVDAGHFQVEMDFINMTYNQPNSERGNVRSTYVELAPVNLKVGLLNNLDFQLVFTSYRWEKTTNLDNGLITQNDGFDGITPRFKVNIVGNDSGFFALALIPFVTLPLHRHNFGTALVEGGLGIPYSFDIPGWDVRFQTTFLFNRNNAGLAYHTEYDNSVSIGHSLIGRFSLSGEFFSSVSTENASGWVGTIDTWLTYQVFDNLRLDGGTYIGITLTAEDWHPWLGMSWRY